MSVIGSARRCCRGCGKERGPGRRRRRRQQPCLSSCSSCCCCCPDSASPAASVSPTAASWPLGPAAVDRAGLQSGRRASGCTRFCRLACGLGTAAVKALAPAGRRVQRYCDRCARASQEGGNLFCAASGIPPSPTLRTSRGNPAAGPPAEEEEDNSCLRFGNFYCQRDFNFSSDQLSTSLQCRKNERAVSMWQDLPTSGKMEFVEPLRGHFSILGWGTFPLMEVQQKGIEATRP